MRLPVLRAVPLAALVGLACLSDRAIEPAEPLPAVLALDKPVVQLVQFELGRKRAADTVTVTNNGERPLGPVSIDRIEYGSGQRQGWLDARVAVRGGDEVLLILTPTYAESAGGPPDTARVLVRAANVPTPRAVVVVARTIPGARFEFSVAPVTFATLPGGDSVVVQELSVRNGGNDTLRIRDPRLAYDGATTGWLRVVRAPASDSTGPSFGIEARPGGLASGIHTAWVVFESAPDQIVRARPDSVLVQLRMGAPRLGVSAGLVTFSGIRGGGAVLPQAVALTNDGEGTLASLGPLVVGAPQHPPGDPVGWLVTRLDGTTLTLEAATGLLAEGTYAATVPIASAHGGMVSLAVTFDVRLPGLTLSSQTLSFNAVEGGTSPPARTVLISNSGSGTLATLGTLGLGAIVFPSGQAGGWLAASLVDSVVTVTPTLGRLSAGTYHAVVPVTSANGGGDDLAVTFTVARATDPPVLSLSTRSVTFAGVRGDPDPAPQRVAITNTGGGTLGTVLLASVSSTGGWLSASIGGPEVSLAARIGGLGAGTYTGSVEVVSQFGGRETILVTFTVGVPVLSLSSTTVTFSATQGGAATPTSEQVAITNSGAGTLPSLGVLTLGATAYGTGQPTGWLTRSLAGSTITLSAAAGGLVPGLYTASVPVSSVNGGGSVLNVSLSVATPAAQPVLALETQSLGFAAVTGGASPAPQTLVYFNSGGGVDADLGAVTVSVPGAATWLAATVGAGTVTFTPSLGSLAAGTYTANATVSAAQGGSRTVAVAFTVAAAGTPAALGLSPGTVSFATTVGSSPAPQSISVVNTGGGSLGTVSLGPVTYGGASSGWLTASYHAGTGVITLTPSVAALPAGSSTASFDVSTSPAVQGSPVTVTVGLTVAAPSSPPAMTLETRSVSFSATTGGSSPQQQTVDITNTGGGGLPALGTLALGSISYGPGATGWLTTASVNSSTGVITLRPATGSLAAGTYTATVPVTASGAASGSPDAITVTFTVVPTSSSSPTLTLSSASVSFAGQAGAANPAAQTIALTNTGDGGLAALGTLSLDSVVYSAGAAGWLTTASLNPSTGVVTLQPATGALAPGTYTATVWLAGTAAGIGSPKTAAVAFTVTPGTAGAVLALSATSVSSHVTVGGAAAAQVITVYNAGSGTLGNVNLGNVTYAGTSSGWLTRSYDAATGALTLTPSTAALPAGSSTATFNVSTAPAVTGSPASVTVRLTVAAASAAPVLTLSATQVSLAAPAGGPNPAQQTVFVSNTGGGSLGALALGAVTYGAGASGWLSRSLSGATITLGAQVAALSAGSYTASFPVTASGSGAIGTPATLTVNLTVAPNRAPPVLTLSSRAVSFAAPSGSSAAPATVTVINTGGGTLASLGAIAIGAITYGGTSSNWLVANLNPATGVVTLTPATSTLPAGTSTATVPVTSASGGASSISVTSSVAAANAPPVLTLSLTALTFREVRGGAPAADQQVTITNAGGGTLAGVSVGTVTYEAGQPAGWLALPASGPLSGSSLTFRVAAGSLPTGVYNASVVVSSANGGSETAAVTLEVQAPVLTLSALAVSFSATQGEADPPGQSVSASNTGVGNQASLGALSIGPIAYGVGEPGAWLSASVSGAAVRLLARTGALPSGTFTARVPVVSEFGGTQTIVTTFTVAPGAAPPVLALSASTVSFSGILGGANPAPQAIAISNQGGQTLGTLTVTPAAPAAPWLDASLQGTRVVFTANTAGLAAGSYSASVTVSSGNAGSLPVSVTLLVGAPRIALSTRSVTFGDTVGSARILTADVFITNSGAGDQAALGALGIGPIRYGGGEPAGWLLRPEGERALASPVVRLEARAGTLPAGSYAARVPVQSTGGGSDTITVHVAVNRPDPALDQPSIQFVQNGVPTGSVSITRPAGDTTQAAVRVTVRNPANTAIGLTGLRIGTTEYLNGAGWISGAFLDKTSAPFDAPAELLVAIAPAGLVPGRYEADVPVSSSVAKNSPQRLRVVLVIQ